MCIDYVVNGDYVSRVDREDLGATWFLLAVFRIIEFTLSGVIARRFLVEKSTRVILGWLAGFAIIGITVTPWFLAGAKPEMEFLSLKESFLLRQLVLIGVAARLLYNRYKPAVN